MESPSQKIIEIIEKIILLLELDGYPDTQCYCTFFTKILKQLHKPHDLSQIARDILSIYGGMGSFNDVVLCKNGNIMIQETDTFGELSNELFTACESIVENNGRILEKQPSALSRLFAKLKSIGN